MKNLFTLLILVFFSYSLYSQCDPDTTCVDTGEPGQMCPDYMPDGRVNESYSQVITVLAPATVDYQGNPINLSHLQIIDIANIPQGLTWQSNAVDNLFEVGTRYCILIEGTPQVPGDYPLGITVKPLIFGIPMPYEIVDDTSLSILIEPELAIYDIYGDDFSIEKPFPNPFENSTEININSLTGGIIELLIFDNLGRRIYFEEKQIITGLNKFHIDGSEYDKGIYNYIIRFEEKVITGKIVKI